MRRLAWAVAATLLATVACTAQFGRTSANPSPTATSLQPVATPAGPCLNASQQPAAPVGPVSALSIWKVASGLNQPDDLLFHDQQLYVGELGTGKIHVFAAGKSAQVLPVTVPKVEGMVFVNGALYVADQQNDRIDVVAGSSVRTLLQLTPVAGQDGVDNISAQGQQLLVPDSPHGIVDWVDLNGRITRSVSGFIRPTGAWPLADGSVLVADEFGNAVVKLSPNGSKTYLIRNLAIADDVAVDQQGSVFAVTPVAGAGRLVQVVSGSARNVATNLAAPQGLAFDEAGNIFFSEPDAGRVDLAIRSFKLLPIAPVRPAAGQTLCVDLVRARGFTGAVTFSGDSGIQVVVQPGNGRQGAVLARSCTASPCKLTAQAGPYRDTLWIRTSG